VIRGPEFSGVSGKMVSVYMPDEGCLLVLDSVYAQYPTTVDGFASYGDLTNFSQIEDSQEESFAPAFGKIDSNQWCYFFEKADLARQQKDWAGVIASFDKAKDLGFAPGESVEYIPLIQALAETGKVEEALHTTQLALQMSKTINGPACKLWQQLQQKNLGVTAEQVNNILSTAGCPVVQP
jgi:tetratricopeptide (TPR) repeat protein